MGKKKKVEKTKELREELIEMQYKLQIDNNQLLCCMDPTISSINFFVQTKHYLIK